MKVIEKHEMVVTCSLGQWLDVGPSMMRLSSPPAEVRVTDRCPANCGWFVRQHQAAPEDLSDEIGAFLLPAKGSGNWRFYPTAEAAQKALSDALIAWAKQKALAHDAPVPAPQPRPHVVSMHLAAWLERGPRIVREERVDELEITDREPHLGTSWWRESTNYPYGQFPHLLPDALFDLLEGGDGPNRYSPSGRVYPDAASAKAALGAAALAWARAAEAAPGEGGCPCDRVPQPDPAVRVCTATLDWFLEFGPDFHARYGYGRVNVTDREAYRGAWVVADTWRDFDHLKWYLPEAVFRRLPGAPLGLYSRHDDPDGALSEALLAWAAAEKQLRDRAAGPAPEELPEEPPPASFVADDAPAGEPARDRAEGALLRDGLAAQAMAAVIRLGAHGHEDRPSFAARVADTAYLVADRMLEERARRG